MIGLVYQSSEQPSNQPGEKRADAGTLRLAMTASSPHNDTIFPHSGTIYPHNGAGSPHARTVAPYTVIPTPYTTVVATYTPSAGYSSAQGLSA